MKKKVLASVVLMFLMTSVFVFSDTAQSVLPQLSYKIPEPKLWLKHNDPEISLVGPAHYYFNQTEDIDLNIVPIDDDLLTSLNERGEKNFIDDIMRGKNQINQMFAAQPSKLVSYKVTNISASDRATASEVVQQAGGEGKLLELRLTQVLGDEEHNILERFFIYPKQAINFQLRSKKSSDPNKVKQAEKLFVQIQPHVRKPASK